MNTKCVEYWMVVEYRIPTNQLHLRTCTNRELGRLVKRRRSLETMPDDYAKKLIILFVEMELMRRGRISEASLIEAVLGETPTTGVRVYYNNTSLIVAVKTFFTADCLLDS